MDDKFKFLDDIDWSGYDTNIELNNELMDFQDDYKIIFSDTELIIDLHHYDCFSFITSSDNFIILNNSSLIGTIWVLYVPAVL